jgi:hypothetical protein
MRDHPKTQTVRYRAKLHPVLKRNVEVFPVLDWIAALTAHILNQGEHLVRDDGWDSTVSRGKRRKGHAQEAAPEGTIHPSGFAALTVRERCVPKDPRGLAADTHFIATRFLLPHRDCPTVKVRPAMVIAPLRDLPLVFSATE